MIRKFQLLLWHFKEEKILFGLPLEIPIEITTKPKGSGLLKYFWVNLLVQNVFTGSCLVMKGEYQTRVLPLWDGWLTFVLSHSFDSHQPAVRIAATSDLAIHGNAREVCGSDLLIDLLCIILLSGYRKKDWWVPSVTDSTWHQGVPPSGVARLFFLSSVAHRRISSCYIISSHIIGTLLAPNFFQNFHKKNPYTFL